MSHNYRVRGMRIVDLISGLKQVTAPAPLLSREVADALGQARSAKGLDVAVLARDMLSKQVTNPQSAAVLRDAVVAQLSPAQRGEFARAITGEPLVRDAITTFRTEVQAIAVHNPPQLKAIVEQVFGNKLSSAGVINLIDQLARGAADEIRSIVITTAQALDGAPAAYHAGDGGTAFVNEQWLANPETLRIVGAQLAAAHVDANLPEAAMPSPRDSALFAAGIERGAPLSGDEQAVATSVASSGSVAHDGTVLTATLIMPSYFLWLLHSRERRAPKGAIEQIWEQLRVNRLACLTHKQGRLNNRHGCKTPDLCDRYESDCPAMLAFLGYSGCPLYDYVPALRPISDS
jgi:hypothetical protein